MTDMNVFQNDPPAPPRRLRYPVLLELIILGGIAIVLMVGLSMIRSLVAERARRANTAQAEIASSWGEHQVVGGPVIVVPFRVRMLDNNGKEHISMNKARFLPDRLAVRGTLVPERRHRGIFESVLYRAQMRMEGEFARPDFSAWSVAPEDILWSEAVVTIGVSDLRGINSTPVLKWNERALPFAGGSGDPKLWPTGLTAMNAFASTGERSARYKFSVDLSLNGSKSIDFYPLGGQTTVELSSTWKDPSFMGAFLPEWRSISEKGFTARWNISSLARSYPQKWRDWGDDSAAALAAVPPSAFSVGLFLPVGHYQQTERSLKYGALFIILTFVTFFLYELLSPVMLHPVQYFLVGGALCLFYLLLLSISEHAQFVVAYSIASIATVTLISAYSAALLQSGTRVLGLFGVLSLLYGYLYVLLQLEDWALLMGSIGLFLILALVMYATRRVDWGAAHTGKPGASEA